jgi:hypothetical protein
MAPVHLHLCPRQERRRCARAMHGHRAPWIAARRFTMRATLRPNEKYLMLVFLHSASGKRAKYELSLRPVKERLLTRPTLRDIFLHLC